MCPYRGLPPPSVICRACGTLFLNVFLCFCFRSGSNLAEVDDGAGASPVNLFMRRSRQALHPLDAVSTRAKGFFRFLFNILELLNFLNFFLIFFLRAAEIFPYFCYYLTVKFQCSMFNGVVFNFELAQQALTSSPLAGVNFFNFYYSTPTTSPSLPYHK